MEEKENSKRNIEIVGSINYEHLEPGDIIVEGKPDENNQIDIDQIRTITNIYGNSFEYFSNGYFHEIKNYYVSFKLLGYSNKDVPNTYTVLKVV